MVIIRADCNSKIGIGHLMRCMSIAERIREAGMDVLFACADDEPAELLNKKGFAYVSLGTHYDDMMAELPVFTDFIKDKKAEWVLVDSYCVTNDYFAELKKYTQVAYMDDMCTRPYLLDMLINYNIQADREDYHDLYGSVQKEPEYLLGLQYVPLRKEFARVELTEEIHGDQAEKNAENMKIQPLPGPVTDILLSTGGADPLNISMDMAGEWLARKEEFKGIRLHIVCGPFYKYTDLIREKYGNIPEIELHFNVNNMIELMDSCQAAVASAGSTIYELCACGIPTVCFYFVENQRRVAEAFGAKTPVISAGDYSQAPDSVKERIFDQLKELIDSDSKRQQVSEKMQELVDGCGAARIAERLK